MKSIETQGRTVDQAIELGLYKLGVTRDQVRIKILEEAGLFNKARVRLSFNQFSEREQEIKDLAVALFEKMGLNVKIFTEETDNVITVNVSGDDAALAIGKHGDGLNAASHILLLMYNRNKPLDNERVKIIVDSHNYRRHHDETLTIIAKKTAAKAVREGHNIKMAPMTSYERLIIHNALASNTKVIAESEGVEPNRRIVIKLADRENRRKDMSQARKNAQNESDQETASNDASQIRADND